MKFKAVETNTTRCRKDCTTRSSSDPGSTIVPGSLLGVTKPAVDMAPSGRPCRINGVHTNVRLWRFRHISGFTAALESGEASLIFFSTVTFIIHENSVTVCLHNCKHHAPVLLTSRQAQPRQARQTQLTPAVAWQPSLSTPEAPLRRHRR